MLNVRSRAGVVGVTAGAAVLLAVPVVSLGQVPAVDEVAGHANEAAQGVLKAAPSLPAQAQAPATTPARQPAPAQTRSAPAGSAPAQSHPAPPQRSSGSSSSNRGGASSAHARAADNAGTGGGQSDRRPKAADDKKNAAPDSGDVGNQPEATGIPATDVQIADGAVDAPRDASPGTLPFTGLQLVLLAMLGLTALVGGALLRRSVRQRA